MDLKKEIHLSDLFRRSAKDPSERPPKEEKPRRRGRKEKPPKAPKEHGRDKAASALLARSAPPLRQVPLMRPFNLLPKEVTRQTRDTRALVPYVLVALLGLLVVAGLAAFFLRASADVTTKQGQVDDLRIELASLEVPEKDPLSGQRTGLAAEKTARTNALAGTLGGRVAFDRLLREIALVIPDGVALIQLSAQSPTATGAVPVAVQTAQPGSGPVQSFTIVGTTRRHETVALTLARLAVIPELSAVSLVSSTEDPRLHIVNFTIKASVRQGGGA
jgi:Tfp pilus assembly protein PilN